MIQQYRALTDAAAQPQMEMIANSKPNPATDAALADARKVPEVESYFRATASNRAKQLNRMSAREFEEFSRSPLQQPCLPCDVDQQEHRRFDA